MSLEGGEEALPTGPDYLSSLADELLLNIIDFIDHHESLCSFSATSKRLQAITEPTIWRKLLVLTGTQASIISTALDGDDNRIDFVQDLSVRYKNENRERIEDLNHYIGQMRRLRHLTLESPCPNNTEWRSDAFFDGNSRIDFSNLIARSVYPREGLEPALPMLQSINLHVHHPNDMKFDFDARTAAIFLHPTVREITISCMNITTDLQGIKGFTENHKTTPLESLTLIECNVNVETLHSILHMPKALKHLEVRERLHIFRECEPSRLANARTSSPRFLDALALQSASLLHLTHIGGNAARLTVRQTDPHGASKLRALARLTHLHLGLESHLYYYLLHSGFPPALRELKLLDVAISNNTHIDFHQGPAIIFNSLKSLVTMYLPSSLAQGFTLHMHFSHALTSQLFALAATSTQARNYLVNTILMQRPTTYTLASALRDRGARLHMSREAFSTPSTAFIPPYMYGEEVPVEVDMYDSDAYWVFNGVDHREVDDAVLRAEKRGKGELSACVRCAERGVEGGGCVPVGVGLACRACWAARVACRVIGEGGLEVREIRVV